MPSSDKMRAVADDIHEFRAVSSADDGIQQKAVYQYADAGVQPDLNVFEDGRRDACNGEICRKKDDARPQMAEFFSDQFDGDIHASRRRAAAEYEPEPDRGEDPSEDRREKKIVRYCDNAGFFQDKGEQIGKQRQ